VSKQPAWDHQITCGEVFGYLRDWNRERRLGRAVEAPGMVFADDDDVVPDVAWISNERLIGALDGARHLIVCPELVVEVLSPGSSNERRDRETKRALYARRGASEYWIVDWRQHEVQVFRRGESGLELAATLGDEDTLSSPLLPGLEVRVVTLWEPV
jgi:Uma2 family endonuclease